MWCQGTNYLFSLCAVKTCYPSRVAFYFKRTKWVHTSLYVQSFLASWAQSICCLYTDTWGSQILENTHDHIRPGAIYTAFTSETCSGHIIISLQLQKHDSKILLFWLSFKYRKLSHGCLELQDCRSCPCVLSGSIWFWFFCHGVRMRARKGSVPLWLCWLFLLGYRQVTLICNLSHEMFTTFWVS